MRYIASIMEDVTSPSVVRCGECSEGGIVGQSPIGTCDECYAGLWIMRAIRIGDEGFFDCLPS